MSFLNALLNGTSFDFMSYQKKFKNIKLSSPSEGIFCFKPDRVEPELKNIVISCGIHGNETAPIEIVDQIFQDILEQNITVNNNLLIIYGNLDAIKSESRFVDFNLNRLFSDSYKKHSDSEIEKSRAEIISNAIDSFFENKEHHKFHFDLHTAIRESQIEKFAVLPFNFEKTHNSEFLHLLKKCGIEAILFTIEHNTTLSNHSCFHHDAYAVTLELGKVRKFGENDLEKLKKLKKTLKKLIKDDFDFKPKVSSKLTLYKVEKNVLKLTEEFQLNFSNDIKNFTSFPKGTVLARDGEKEYISISDDECVVFPNSNVKLGQRALYTAMPFTTD